MGTGTQTAARKNRMAVLARCRIGRLQELWTGLDLPSAHTTLRGPESGLVMLRGRIGGTGESFNVGEATVTRASVKIESGAVGHAIALGRDTTKARLSAIIDALCQNPETADLIDKQMIAPMQDELDRTDETRRQQTAATRVDFFTMVRGED